MQSNLRKQLRQFLRQSDRRNLPSLGFLFIDGDGRSVTTERRQDERRSPCLGDLIPLFNGVEDEPIYAAIGGCHVAEHAARQVLLEIGQINRHVFILLSGDVTIEIGDAANVQRVSLARGESVGEMSAADDTTASARVIAEAGSRLLIIDGETFWNKVVALPRIARNLMIILAARQRRSNAQLIERLRGEMLFTQIKRDLAMAAEIQINMLPGNFPLYAHRAEFDVFASMVPARDVGGDFYDVFMVGPDHLFFVIGDVSGKGVAAALFMARAMTLFRTEAAHHLAPHEVLHRVNCQLAMNNDRCMFVTVVCGVLDVRNGRVTYSNAGHALPLVGGGGAFRYIELPYGTAIGLDEGSAYTSMDIRLQPGDMLFLYTDGVTEAVDGADTQYSEERLLAELTTVGAANCIQTVKHVGQSIDAFTHGVSQFDDITMLAIMYRSADGAAQPWNEAWNLGIFELDRQHRSLLDLLNQMVDLMQVNPHASLSATLCDEFRRQYSQHLESEDRLLGKIEPLARESHQESHARFSALVSRLLGALAMEKSGADGLANVTELRRLWLHHIEHQDADFLLRKG